MTGYEDMPKAVANATDDIRHHLWSLYWICRLLRAKRVVELGVRGGDSTRALLAAMKDTGGRLTSFDIAGDAYDVRRKTEDMGIPWRDIWECRKGDSADAGVLWRYGPLDVVFVDTLHTHDHTLRELQAWEGHVRGAMVFHDTGNTEPHQNGVRPAIDAFLAKNFERWSLEDHPRVAERDVGLGILWRLPGR